MCRKGLVELWALLGNSLNVFLESLLPVLPVKVKLRVWWTLQAKKSYLYYLEEGLSRG